MSIFGWDYPPGCHSVPGDEERAIDLTDGKTLAGHGRTQHGINGKDADLGPCGQNVVTEAWWLEDGAIHISGYRYATIGCDDDWTEEQKDTATELVCGCDIAGERTGDEWSLREDYEIRAHCDWDDELTDEQNKDRAIAAALDAIDKDSTRFESELELLHRCLAQLDSTDSTEWRKDPTEP